jgi:adenosylhomocysteine nucleosidase
MNKHFFLLIFCLALSLKSFPQREKRIAIIGAFSKEVMLLEEAIKNPKVTYIQGIKFTTGQLEGQNVVVALTGVGKVNAAMTTTLILNRWKPTAVVFTGIAGGLNPNLKPADIVIGLKTIQHDYGLYNEKGFVPQPTRKAIDYTENEHYFDADSQLITLAKEAANKAEFKSLDDAKPNVVTGIIVTGDAFVNSQQKVDELIANFKADATEMEGAAVAQVCLHFKTPCLVIRSLSDKANESAKHDMQTFLSVAAYNSSNLVKAMLKLQSVKK